MKVNGVYFNDNYHAEYKKKFLLHIAGEATVSTTVQCSSKNPSSFKEFK
jgi:hypothetical protein